MAYDDVMKNLKIKNNLYVGGQITAQQAGANWFVDGDISVSGSGTSWGGAFKTIQEAVTAAAAKDTIFILEKDITDFTGDPSSYAETVIIPATKPGLRLIGVANGVVQGGMPQIKPGAGSTPILTIRAAGCLIEGLGFNGAGSTGGGILLDDDYATKCAFGTVIRNCHFKNCVGASASDGTLGAAIRWTTAGNAWQVKIEGNEFYKNLVDISLQGTSNTQPQDVSIINNIFHAGATSDVCIETAGSGFSTGTIIAGNMFGPIPSVGSGTGKYTVIVGTGMFNNNLFGAAGTTTGYGAARATADIGTGFQMCNNYSNAGLIVRQ